MRVNEILENKDHIRTYWGLRNIDIDGFRRDFEALRDLYYATQNPLLKTDLITLYSHLDELLRNPNWAQLEHDPDYSEIYDSLLDLYDQIKSVF